MKKEDVKLTNFFFENVGPRVIVGMYDKLFRGEEEVSHNHMVGYSRKVIVILEEAKLIEGGVPD